MHRLFAFFHRELKGMHQAAFLLAVVTTASSALALLRDRLLASHFGAGTELDIYYASFRVPDILYAISLFFAASTAIMPVFLERLEASEEKARELVGALATVFVLGMAVILAIAFFALPFFMPHLAPGFSGEEIAEATLLARILLLSPLLLGLSNLAASVIQAHRRFFVYALSPVFYNLGIIAGILFFMPRFGLPGLAWGVVLGALLHVLIQAPSIIQLGYVPRPVFALPADVRRIFMLSFPRTIGIAANQFIFIAITALASTLGVGSIAVFNLSYNLQSIPLSVIGLSYSVAAFPTMAELIVKKEKDVFFQHLSSASRHIFFWTLPASLLFIVLRAQIVRVIFGTGDFGWVDTRLTAASLALFSLGIVAQSLGALFIRAFYALGKTKMPVILILISSMFTIVFAFVFVRLFAVFPVLEQSFGELLRVGDLPNIPMLGLPLAFALGSVLNALLLGAGLWHREQFHIEASFYEIIIASGIVGVVSYIGLRVFSPVFDLNTFAGIFLQGLLAGVAGIAAAALFLKWRGNREFLEIINAIQKKFWREKVVASEQEQL